MNQITCKHPAVDERNICQECGVDTEKSQRGNNAEHTGKSQARLKIIELCSIDHAPHHCTDPKCPGNINRLKIEAFDKILKADSKYFPHRDFAGTVDIVIAEFQEATK